MGLLELPVELQERILAFALQPDGDPTTEKQTSTGLKLSPQEALLQRLTSAAINKHLYSLALPAYFYHTELNAIVSRGQSRLFSIPLGRYVPYTHSAKVTGTFSATNFFFKRTRKLKMEIKNVEAAEKVYDILAKCKSLAQLTVCVHSLNSEDGDKVFAAITALMEKKKLSGAKRKISMERQTLEKCDCDAAAAAAARSIMELRLDVRRLFAGMKMTESGLAVDPRVRRNSINDGKE